MLRIEPATKGDLPQILTVYDTAREFMRQTGNPTQWQNGHPNRRLLEEDLAIGKRLYVVRENGVVHGVFAFLLGEDPTYARIDGAWKDASPYGTIHRIAADGSVHGVFDAAVRFCEKICGHIRIDTHKDNLVMQHLIAKNGFEYCGIIYLENGDPRLAYEKSPLEKR